jgi:lipopolysaccharide/colanic/teichoic acid biosynthesis glycosyltransferase
VQGSLPLEKLEKCWQYPMPIWKRAMDILGSVLGLMLLSPLFLVTGLLIKSVSKGPVFFRQERIGHKGKIFRLWKFRTYEHNAPCGAQHARYVSSLINVARQGKDAPQQPMKKLDNAPGIIPGGLVLRKTCIDELPQLINVLLGEMSLVGPRPAIVYEVEQYADWHKRRLLAIPGMTGLWQVSGKNRLTFNEMVRLDIRYARRKSFRFDVKILMKTPLAIISQIQDSLKEGRSGIADSPC